MESFVISVSLGTGCYRHIQISANATLYKLHQAILKAFEFEDDHEQETYHIVGKQEADLAKQKISFDSPLGQALLHKTAGTTVTVEAPQSSYKVKIVKVEL